MANLNRQNIILPYIIRFNAKQKLQAKRHQ